MYTARIVVLTVALGAGGIAAYLARGLDAPIAALRALATQDDGPVFLAGNGTFLESDDTGVTWRKVTTLLDHFGIKVPDAMNYPDQEFRP